MDSNIGRKLDGRYEITELIGVGGMADVYKATDIMENRTVAVKILKDEFSNSEEFLRRFRNESKAIALLSHPNIVKIYDVGFTDEIQFIVMEYIDGITLKEFIDQQGVLRWKDALHFITQILRALQHAHDKGIVHRDIKPQNIMLFSDGTIKVMDFGIARFARIDGKTLSDKTIGSVHYISPEQARGDITDERSDLYSVGVMLYEMFTGKKPFDGDNPVAIALKHMEEDPVPPRDLMPALPEALEEIVLHAMERDPARRYQSAAEMIKDIDRFKVDQSVVFGYKNNQGETTAVEKAPANNVEEYFEEDYDNEDDDTNKRSYVVPILMAVTVAVVIIAAVLIAYFVIANFSSSSTHKGNVEIKDFVGRNIVEVEQEYAGRLQFDKAEEYNDEYDEGIIFEQEQKAGTLVREGYTIKVKVSRGKRMIQIPDVKNKKSDIAESELISAGFTPVLRETYDNDVAKGLVIRTEPGAGQEAPSNSEVLVIVSKGPFESDLKVPNVIGLTKEKAIAKLTENKLKYQVEEVAHEGDKGKVVEQSVAGGQFVSKDTVITIFISTGEAQTQSLTISMPMPYNIWGSYVVEVYRDGNVIQTISIADGAQVAGSNINIDVTGKKSETLSVKITNSQTYQSVSNYARYAVDYENMTYNLDGELKTSDVQAISSPQPTTTTTTTTAAPVEQPQAQQPADANANEAVEAVQ
ncbi:MAG: Stk1 family PASTA domain-containing Ser/Thr kinase [Ruminococcus sp.]|nr:Stk1 family PASTA domain-containing Ser/Thr kinase [Ruminococcus sp.]